MTHIGSTFSTFSPVKELSYVVKYELGTLSLYGFIPKLIKTSALANNCISVKASSTIVKLATNCFRIYNGEFFLLTIVKTLDASEIAPYLSLT